MSNKDVTLEEGLPELAYGSVWLVSAGDGDPNHLSSLSIRALRTAAAVIHDPGLSQQILDLVMPPRYCEAVAPGRAIERTTKLAQDGWRVVYLVQGDAMERAIECATRFAEHNIPFRIAPNGEAPLSGQRPIGLLLVRKAVPVVGRGKTDMLVVLIATSESETTSDSERRQAPLSFSMSGLAG